MQGPQTLNTMRGACHRPPSPLRQRFEISLSFNFRIAFSPQRCVSDAVSSVGAEFFHFAYSGINERPAIAGMIAISSAVLNFIISPVRLPARVRSATVTGVYVFPLF